MEGRIWQLPLRLLALTIHCVQGMTLEQAELRTREIFEYGQGYVGSRVKTLNGLFLHDLDPGSIRADPHVIIFHESSYQAQYKGDVNKALQAQPQPLSMIGKIMAANGQTCPEEGYTTRNHPETEETERSRLAHMLVHMYNNNRTTTTIIRKRCSQIQKSSVYSHCRKIRAARCKGGAIAHVVVRNS
jgi:hypothetical protein